MSTHQDIESFLSPIRFARALIESSTACNEPIFVILQCCLLPDLARTLLEMISLLNFSQETYLSPFLKRMNVNLFRMTRKLEYLLQGKSSSLQRSSTKSKVTSGILQDIFTLESLIDMFTNQKTFTN